MHRLPVLVLLALAALLGAPRPAAAGDAEATARALAAQMRWAGSASGAHVVDLTTGEAIYSSGADRKLVPASVNKLFTTTASLLELGPKTRLRTAVSATAAIDLAGVLDGDLYLRGEGDPTLTGADLSDLAAGLIAETGLTEVTGRVIGDESAFDALRGPPSSRYRVSAYVGPLGALVVDRGRTGRRRPYWQPTPARYAARAFAAALRDLGVDVRPSGGEAETPPGALPLTAIDSPPLSTLARLTNAPSDNFVAETLLKALGAIAVGEGSTAAGAAVVERSLEALGIHPRVVDGSGLSRSDRASARQVTRLLARIYDGDLYGVLRRSLAIAGRTGTLHDRMRRSAARRRCRGKTGTLASVSALAGYCETPGGDVAFAILMNRVNPYGARVLQDRMLGALARYEP